MKRLSAWLDSCLQRWYERRHPVSGIITVELAADSGEFATDARIRALRQTPGVIVMDMRPFRAALQRAAKALTAATNNPALQRLARHHTDLQEIRMLAATELVLAQDHLDQHVDTIYADLGLERPTKR